jgi:DNA-binding transcriptional MerR regulator
VTSRPVYSIGAVARMLDIPPATLRTWEERYGLPVPERSPGGHRLYSRDQVDQLRFIKAQLAQGMAPADAHRLLAERLAAGSLSFGNPEPGKTRLLILLAERDPHAAELSEYFLRTEGYEVAAALDAADATRRSEELTPSMTVIDLLISGGGGLELCRQLKQRSDAPILAVSTLDTSDAALEAGADAFLQKPLDPLQLVSAIKDLLGASAFLRRTAGGLALRPGRRLAGARPAATSSWTRSWAAASRPTRSTWWWGRPAAARPSWPSSTSSTTPTPSGLPST